MAEPAPVHQEGLPRGLPFTFAKERGVLLDRSEGQLMVVHTGQLGLEVLTELRRFLGEPFRLQAGYVPKQ